MEEKNSPSGIPLFASNYRDDFIDEFLIKRNILLICVSVFMMHISAGNKLLTYNK